MIVIQDYVSEGYVIDYYVAYFDLSTLSPDYGAGLEYTQKTNTYAAALYQQRTEDGINETSRKWAVSFTGKSVEIAFLESTLSSYAGTTNFAWIPPTGLSGNWTCQDISVSEDGYENTTLSTTFEEVFIL